ncbi:MAG: hypothetical protein R3B70_01300 [Polyangiaceae bacterium]
MTTPGTPPETNETGPETPEIERPRGGMRRRAAIVGALGAAAAGVLAWFAFFKFPPDTTPEGAYMRIAAYLGDGDSRGCFSYLEDAAQHAAYTIRDYRKKASDRIAAAYPEPERDKLLEQYRPFATAPDGADVWVLLASQRGWIGRLRRDLTGVAKVEVNGDRATVETTGGTRYPFRRRANAIWGLAMFTAELVAEAERAARDFDVVDKAAADYERARGGR